MGINPRLFNLLGTFKSSTAGSALKTPHAYAENLHYGIETTRVRTLPLFYDMCPSLKNRPSQPINPTLHQNPYLTTCPPISLQSLSVNDARDPQQRHRPPCSRFTLIQVPYPRHPPRQLPLAPGIPATVEHARTIRLVAPSAVH